MTNSGDTNGRLLYKKNSAINAGLLAILPDLLRHFGLVASKTGDKFILKCPIHGGNKNSALYINSSGNFAGTWKCWTRADCNAVFGRDIFGFIRGILSHIENGWCAQGDEAYPISSVCKYIEDHFEVPNVKVKPSVKQPERLSPIGIPRELVLESLKVPSQYYLDRGFSESLLRTYDIGTCFIPGKWFYNRAVIPLYDESGRYMIGASGRSIFDECISCGTHHSNTTNCPSGDYEILKSQKWLHSKGFSRERYLYNFYKNIDLIKQRRTVVLVESPGNVLRLVESGILESVASFGTSFNTFQKSLLDSAGVRNVCYCYDADDAGRSAGKDFSKKYGNVFNIKELRLPPEVNDIGDMSIMDVSKHLKPQLNRIYKEWQVS